MNDSFVILIVDDNPNNLFTLRALLKRLHDCTIVEADSGEEALARVVERPVNLILLDVQMPGMDGFETARHLQMTERTRHIPVIFITAVFKAEEFVRRGYEIGAIDYLTKPIDDNLLLNRIRLYQRIFQRERQLEEMIELLQQNEHTLAAARDAAESANRMKSVFLANMSHELRTPLNAILGFAQIMERDERIPADERSNLATINRSGRHLLSLINDVLEISRIEAGRLHLQPQPCDLHELVRSAGEIVMLRAHDKGLELRSEIGEEVPPYIVTDPGKLRQILLNLLTNAVKYTQHGRVVLSVHAALRGEEAALEFAVRDTGVGIASKDLKTIFEPFYQTAHGIALGEGTGLGLTISRSYARLLGGDLAVESQLGKGSTFRLYFDAQMCDAPDDQFHAHAHGRVLGLAPGERAWRVLIAEDDPDSRRLLEAVLRQAGFEVCVSENGAEAVAQYQAWQPDFIWLDMRMPVMNGYEAARQIRALPGGREVKIAALTASVFIESREEILASGCDGVLAKPLEEEKLFAMMGNLLGVHYRYAETPSLLEDTPASSNFAQLPPPLRQRLQDAALNLEVETVRAIAAEIEPDHPELAAEIGRLVENYAFDQLVHELELTPPVKGIKLSEKP